ncbi:penicillin-binding transpeptidase domain-containing protein [Desulfuromonas versatilis]|nr:penicillin-binding transpeptidase domain-containing protein [Desulfuromonas versatilis]
MRKSFKHSSRQSQGGSWRDYQAGLQRRSNGRRLFRRVALRGLVVALLGTGLFFGLQALPRGGDSPSPIGAAQASLPALPAAGLTGKKELRQLLDQQAFNNLTEKALDLPVDGQVLRVETSLDVDLQNYLLERLDRKHSRYLGIVVMEADTGRILAMVGFDRENPSGNPCLLSEFPAASIFKIVTAASAVDQCGYTADSPMQFNGYKHTLYKRQLTQAVNRNTNTLSFEEAFAQSVNPVFGKLGQLSLGREQLEKSASAFAFNEPLDFELPLAPSHFTISDQPYHWAELASGFNRETTISPLHGALMASAVLNDGRMVEPSIVDRVVGADGEQLYLSQPQWGPQAMSAKASSVLSRMMEGTVESGTARKFFRGYQKDRALADLEIGGKTGSIDSSDHEARYDWFVGFAKERQGPRQLVVAAMVAHEKFIGTRASQYARMAMTRYFGQESPGRN